MNAFLTGERIILRSLEMDDLELFWTWFADREVVRYSMGAWIFPWSKSETEIWLKRTIEDKETLSVGVVEKETGCLIGYAGIASMSRVNHSGEYFILLGEKKVGAKGMEPRLRA